MSIATEIERIKLAKSAIRMAVNARGGNLSENQLLDDYASGVSSLPLGENIDLSFVSALAENILAGKVGADKDGNPVEGTIQTVSATLSDNVATIPKGYIAQTQTLTVANAQAPSVSGNVVTIYKGYQANQTTATVAKATSSVSGNVVTIPAGYHDATTKTVAEMAEPSVSGNMVTIPVGYNKEEKILTIAEAIEVAVDGNRITIPAGYIAEEKLVIIPAAPSPAVNGNTVTIYPGYVAEERRVTVAGSGGGSATSGSMEFYKCAAVYGPRQVKCFTVSGCPVAAANGDYLPTAFFTEDWEGSKYPVYSNGKGYFYYYEPYDWWSWGISTDYTSSSFIYNGSGSSWSDNNWESVSGMSCLESETTVDLDVPKTWDGYKAVKNGEIYTFDGDLTSGLPWSGSKPEVFKVYPADASIQLAALPLNYPTDQLIFHAPLYGDVTATAVGGSLRNTKNTTQGEVDGVPAAYFDNNATLDARAPIPINTGDDTDYSMFFCMNPTQAIHDAVPVTIGQDSNYGITAEMRVDGEQLYLRFSGNDANRVQITLNAWNCITFVRKKRKNYIYVGKTLAASFDHAPGMDKTSLVLGAMWANDTRFGFKGYLRDLMIYNRALSEPEIAQLNDVFAM